MAPKRSARKGHQEEENMVEPSEFNSENRPEPLNVIPEGSYDFETVPNEQGVPDGP